MALQNKSANKDEQFVPTGMPINVPMFHHPIEKKIKFTKSKMRLLEYNYFYDSHSVFLIKSKMLPDHTY